MKTRTGIILVNLGVVIIIGSLLLQISELRKENTENKKLIEVYSEQITQCNKELNDLYGAYIGRDD